MASSSSIPDISSIVSHYESSLDAHGPTAKGVDWPNEDDLRTRFRVMMQLIDSAHTSFSLLDLGCGPGLLLDYLNAEEPKRDVDYLGIDISPKMIEAARTRFPSVAFRHQDILTDPLPEESVDYVVMNGVLTERQGVSERDMVMFAHHIIPAAYRCARRGIAFNVMSAHVDWRRDDLFHLSFDDLARFLTSDVSRHFVFRADYGLYEYTAYVYRAPHHAP